MSTVWVCQGKGLEPEYFDTENAAESRRAWLEQSKTVTTAVVYPRSDRAAREAMEGKRMNEIRPTVKVARDLREIEELHVLMLVPALIKSRAQIDGTSLPGGDAMIALAPVANQEAWEHRYETAERLQLPTNVDLEDDTDQSPLQIIRYWSDRYRAVLGAEWDHIPTIASEANFLRFHLDWIAGNEPAWPHFADAIRGARIKSENILYAGDRAERSRIVCDDCDNPRRLIKIRTPDDSDQWKCTTCQKRFGEDELQRAHAKMLRSEGAEKWVQLTEATATLRVQGRPERTVRQWVSDGEGAAYCDPVTHKVWVWWPDLWRKHLSTPTRKRAA